MRERLFSTLDMVKETGLSPETVRSLARRGIISPARYGTGRRIYTPSDVERIRAYLKARREQK